MIACYFPFFFPEDVGLIQRAEWVTFTQWFFCVKVLQLVKLQLTRRMTRYRSLIFQPWHDIMVGVRWAWKPPSCWRELASPGTGVSGWRLAWRALSASCLAEKRHESGNAASSFPSLEEKQRKQILINISTNTVSCPPRGTEGQLSEVIYN